MTAKVAVAVLMASVMVWYPAVNLAAVTLPLGKVLPGGAANLNGTRILLETTVYSGDTVATTGEGVALLLLPKGDQLHVGPTSQVQVTQTGGALQATLERGVLLARSGSGQTITVQAGDLTVIPLTAALYEVAAIGSDLVVSALKGGVTVQGPEGQATITAGKALQFELAQAKPAPKPAPKAAPKPAPRPGVEPWYKQPKYIVPLVGGAAAVVIIAIVAAGEESPAKP